MKAELTIKGMKCSNCASKVEKLLKENEKINTVHVNLITDKVYISLKIEEGEENFQNITEDLKQLLNKFGFTIININIDMNKKNNKNRLMTYKIHFTNEKDIETIKNELHNIQGIHKINMSEKVENKDKNNINTFISILKIEYDPILVKGINLFNTLELIMSNLSNFSHSKQNTQLDIAPDSDPDHKINTQIQVSDVNVLSPYNISITAAASTKPTFHYQNQLILNLESITSHNTRESFAKFLACIFLTVFLMYLTMSDNSNLSSYLQSINISSKSIFSLYLLTIIVLSVILILIYGLPIYKRAISSYLNDRTLNMESLITLGSLSAIILALINLLKTIFNENINSAHGITHSIEAAVTVVTITTIGKYIEDRAKSNIRKQKMNMFNNMAKEHTMKCTWMLARNRKFLTLEEKEVDVGLIEKDDLIKLKEKDFLMLDGVIVHGEIEVKEDITFGYDIVERRATGDKIKAGCKVVKGSCVIMVEEVLENSLICKLTEEVSSNLNQKLKFQNFLDKIIRMFVPSVIISAVIIFIIWMIIYIFIQKDDSKINFGFVIEKPISILVVSCPCAFGLAIPTVITIALNLGLKYGILIKNVSILSEIKDANIFVFDKTGTLTNISREIKIEYDLRQIKEDIQNEINSMNRVTVNDLKNFPMFDVIAEIEKTQKHPIAELIYSFCIKAKKITNHKNFSIELKEVKSSGIEAFCILENIEYEIRIGNLEFIKRSDTDSDTKVSFNEMIQSIIQTCAIDQKLSLSFVSINDEIVIIFSIDSSSNLRSEATSVVDYLQYKLNKEVYILSGDSIESVKEVGKKLKIPQDHCLGNVDNRNKKEILQKLKKDSNSPLNSNKILMIGDGINDVLSLSEADFGISFNTNSNLNLIASDIIFVKDDLGLILSLLKLSRLSFKFIVINVFWAFAYNICMIPITAGIFYAWDINISPTISSFSMLCSSLLILVTSNVLRFFKLNYDLRNRNTRMDKMIEIKSLTDTDRFKSTARSEDHNLDPHVDSNKIKRMDEKIYQQLA